MASSSPRPIWSCCWCCSLPAGVATPAWITGWPESAPRGSERRAGDKFVRGSVRLARFVTSHREAMLIKSLVGRLSSKDEGSSGGGAGQAQPPRQESSPEAAQAAPPPAPQNTSKGEGKSGSRRRRPRKAEKTDAAWSPADFVVEPREGVTRFHDLGLRDELLHAVADLNFEYCSPIQGQV